jgi:hypothetical protein
MSLRPLLYAWVAFVLLFAQQGAYTHALTHLTLPAPAQHQPDKDLPHSPVCDKCVVYGEIGGTLHATPLTFSGSQATFFQPPAVAYDHSPRTPRVYSPRAPPSFV